MRCVLFARGIGVELVSILPPYNTYCGLRLIVAFTDDNGLKNRTFYFTVVRHVRFIIVVLVVNVKDNFTSSLSVASLYSALLLLI